MINQTPEENNLNNQQIEEFMQATFERLVPRIERRLEEKIYKDQEGWLEFNKRLTDNFPRLFRNYYLLYSDNYDFYFHLEELLIILSGAWFQRSPELKRLDWEREQDPLWFQSNTMLGAVCYVDLFANNLEGIREAIPYFKEIGLTYLHLMPPYRVPVGENDGGYAVISYREINPSLGDYAQLINLGKDLRNAGISLVLDFVFNHTSDEHEWALRALAGERKYQDYYWIFPDRQLPDAYERSLREIFPDDKKVGVRTGSFTYRSEIKSWVWTTFHSYQWDLNYSNPEVFNSMVEEMLSLANRGVEILRLDAVAFIWKKMGTSCENQPEAHLLIEAFNFAARIAAPSLLFKSEAIVHPDDVVKYIDPDQCQLSYNPMLMALLWNSLATREVRLLNLELRERFEVDQNCCWVNYVRSHDDIGWTFSDESASRLGINAIDHRKFLNDFYTGQFPGSFARGLFFQENRQTGDVRISGTCASLAGLEKALFEETEQEVELAVRRILLIHAVILTIGGIPLIYLGDEVGTLNDYSYKNEPAKSTDNRWVHRPYTDWKKLEKRKDFETIEGKIFQRLVDLIILRKSNPIFRGNRIEVINTGNEHVLGYIRPGIEYRLIVLANFSEESQTVKGNQLRLYGGSYEFSNLINGEKMSVGDIDLDAYEFLCLSPEKLGI